MTTTMLLLLADGRYPGGGHAHSCGLEPAVADGSVADLPSFESFLTGRLLTTGLVDAWLAAAACAGADPRALDAEADARCASPALRQASRRLGRGLRRAAAVRWPSLSGAGAEHQAVVQGLVARAAGLEPEEAAHLPVASLLAGAASAACRLLPIDAAEAVAVTTRLAPLADGVAGTAAASARLSLDQGPVAGTPLLERRAEEHAAWEVRLFAS
ncbi:MAG TPA: urease accessory UreF family protein [Actinomycetota bacterium]|nr:urease accessory UreF family protein [Actinomycetota bacterium]